MINITYKIQKLYNNNSSINYIKNMTINGNLPELSISCLTDSKSRLHFYNNK